jgi:hypothetical protein
MFALQAVYLLFVLIWIARLSQRLNRIENRLSNVEGLRTSNLNPMSASQPAPPLHPQQC